MLSLLLDHLCEIHGTKLKENVELSSIPVKETGHAVERGDTADRSMGCVIAPCDVHLQWKHL